MPEPNVIDEDPKGVRPPLGEIGQSGTLIYSGIITQEEYNNDLIGRNGITIYDQMRRSDATVRAALDIVKLPILATEWTVEDASDDPIDVEIGSFVRANLFDRVSFPDFLRELMTMLDFGFSVFEKVYELDTWNGQSRIMVCKLASRKQKTIYRWETQEQGAGVTQFVPGGGFFSIPEEKLMIFTNEREGNNFEGISVLRPAYRNWYVKDALYKISAIAMERQGLGVPKITPPPVADEAGKAKAIEAAQNMRANEKGYIMVPNNWGFEMFDMKANTLASPDTLIQHHDRQILKSVMAQFLEIGSHSGSGGAKSSSQNQSQYLDLKLEAISKNIETTIQQEFINQLVELNYPNAAKPRLQHGKVGDDNLSVFATAVSQLGTAGFMTPDPDLEQAFRDMMNLPSLPEETAAGYATRSLPGAGQPAVGTPKAAPPSEGEVADTLDISAAEALVEQLKLREGIKVELNRRAQGA